MKNTVKSDVYFEDINLEIRYSTSNNMIIIVFWPL